jgi:CHAT domain
VTDDPFDAPQDRDLFDSAEHAWCYGNWASALELYLQLLLQRLSSCRGKLPPHVRVLLERIADLAVPFGLEVGAESLLQSAVASAAQDNNVVAAVYYQLKLAHLALIRGRPDEAKKLIAAQETHIGPLRDTPTRAEDLDRWEDGCWKAASRPDRSLMLSRLYLVAGIWLSGRGFFSHAALLLERGAMHAMPPAPALACRALAALRLALATTLLEQGKFAACGGVLADIRDMVDPRQQPAQYVEWLELRGKLDLLHGDFGAALRGAEEVVSVCRRGGFSRAAMAAVLNQAQALLFLNQTSAAADLVRCVDRTARAAQAGTALARAEFLAVLVRARAISLGRPGTAPSVIELWRGRSSGPRGGPIALGPPPELLPAPTYLALFEDRSLELQWAMAAGDLGSAGVAFDRLRDTFQVGESALVLSRLHLYGGMLALDRGDAIEAERVLDDVIPHLERLGLRPDLWQALRLRASCADRHGQPEQRNEYSRRADSLLSELTDSLSGAQRAVYGWNKWAAEEEGLARDAARLAEEASRAQTLATPACWIQQCRLQAFLDRLDEARREVFRSQSGRPNGTLTERGLEAGPFTPPADRAVLSFLVLPEIVYIYRACSGRLDTFCRPLRRHELRALVARWIENVSGGDHVRADELAEELSCGLGVGDLLRGLPPNVRRLTVAPDDSLHGFPFAALRHGGRYLTEDYAISVTFDRSQLPVPPAAGAGELLVVAVASGVPSSPEYPRGIPPLPGTILEGEQTADWFRSRGVTSAVLVDGAAKKAGVLARWREATFVHIACHGIFRPDRPDASGLVLVAQDGRPEVLSLRDLSQVTFQRLRHVTLSNCWLADSFMLPGRMSVSLPEALCRSGAGSVLGCLWPVHDEEGAEFMNRFYHHADGLPRDEAAAAARRDFIRQRSSRRRLPYYWAGFQIYGDPGPLFEQNASPPIPQTSE